MPVGIQVEGPYQELATTGSATPILQVKHVQTPTNIDIGYVSMNEPAWNMSKRL